MLTRSLLPSRQDRPWGSRLSPASRGWWGGVTAWGPPTLGDMRAGEDRAWRAKPQRGGEGHLRRQRKGMLPQNSGGVTPKLSWGGGEVVTPKLREGMPQPAPWGDGGESPAVSPPGAGLSSLSPTPERGPPLPHTPELCRPPPLPRGASLSPSPCPHQGGGSLPPASGPGPPRPLTWRTGGGQVAAAPSAQAQPEAPLRGEGMPPPRAPPAPRRRLRAGR